MKKTIFILLFIAFGECCSYGQTIPASTGNQTEEYAIIHVNQVAKSCYIEVFIGSNSKAQSYDEKEDVFLGMTSTIREMEKLNKLGYELFSHSCTQFNTRYFHHYIFKKKKN